MIAVPPMFLTNQALLFRKKRNVTYNGVTR